MYTTYSFRDVAMAMNHDLAGTFLSSGQKGFGRVTIRYATERSSIDMSADGNAMISFIDGDNGSLEIEVQQTSDINTYLFEWFNAIKTAAQLGDSTEWASMTVTVNSLTTGKQHVLTGVCPSKPADSPYAAQGSRITWNLLVGDVETFPS